MSSDRSFLANLTDYLRRDFEPGDKVPGERELADNFGVGRGQVREAMSVLQAYRVVEARPKSGAYVADGPMSIEALALFGRLGLPIARREIQEALEVRRINEVSAITLAVERATAGDIARLEAILDVTRNRIAAGEPINIEDRAFHLALVAAAHNSLLLDVVTRFYNMTDHNRLVFFRDRKRCAASLAEHEKMFGALRDRSMEQALALMQEHLTGAESHWTKLIDAKETRSFPV